MLRLAHRGDWRRAPENTLAAFRAALALPGCDGLEFDVRGSADGVPVVIHDETLARVQGRRERADELGAVALGAFGVPSLAAVLAATTGAFLDVELKGPPLPAIVGVLEAARGPYLEGACVSSFEPLTLAWLRGARPAWPRWLNAEELSEVTISGAVALGCAGISAEWHAIDRASAAWARSAGLQLGAWTVRRRSTAARLEGLDLAFACVEGAALDG